MKERIRKVMEREDMSQKEFSAAIGISQASLSSILNGRTQPTSRLVEAIHRRFPDISTNWIMFGEGQMAIVGQAAHPTPEDAEDTSDYVGESVRPEDVNPTFFNSAQPEVGSIAQKETLQQPPAVVREIIKYVDKPQRRVREIQVIYDDGMLETFVLKTDK
ncbi:MAG: helix-turn-helix transcriptional regulator [Bacteroidaceae bacterium]|nr:helix-turn-helix transcriptional regulator [Bacteroidaceae bacterium]MBR1790100.1 helix-turn-helix transcriptional regulator [Bacteroidaceae bacterium]